MTDCETACKFIVVADAGGTKIDWRAADVSAGAVVAGTSTRGVSPLRDGADRLSAIFSVAADELGLRGRDVAGVHYYGSGCIGGDVSERVRSALSLCFGSPMAETEVESDMLGAARALCGSGPGIACIVGTGSNSCLYDGSRIIDNTPPLGYILGDEGSGAWLGRELVCGVLKGFMPREIAELFREDYPELTKNEIIRRVYSEDAPNAFLASLSRFYSRHASEEVLRAAVARGYGLFIDRNLARYDGVEGIPVSFTGSVACAFEPLMRLELSRRGLTAGCFEPRPIERLTAYHIAKTRQ